MGSITKDGAALCELMRNECQDIQGIKTAVGIVAQSMQLLV